MSAKRPLRAGVLGIAAIGLAVVVTVYFPGRVDPPAVGAAQRSSLVRARRGRAYPVPQPCRAANPGDRKGRPYGAVRGSRGRKQEPLNPRDGTG